MIGALRAERLRFLRRPDVWGAVLVVAGFAGGTLVASYLDAIGRVGVGVGPVPVGLPPEIARGMALARQPFAFPQSLLTVLGGAWPIPFALALVALATIGGEFSWGTVRSSLLAGTSRTQFLAARFATLGVLAVLMLAIVFAIGALFPLILAVTGERLPVTPSVSLTGVLADYAARLLGILAYTSLGALLAVATRSMAAGALLGMAYLLTEAIGLGSAMWSTGPAGWIQNLSLGGSTQALIEAARRAAGELTLVDELRKPFVPPLVSLVVVTLWVALPAVAAVASFRRMDITE